jgi:AAA domain
MTVGVDMPAIDMPKARRARQKAEREPQAPAAPANGNGTDALPMPYTLLRDIKPNLTCNEIIKGLIPRGGLGEVHAEAGGGKTAIIVDLLLHIAAELEYRGRRVERAPVVFVALEGHAGIGNRVLAAAAELAIKDAPFALVKASDNFRDPTTAQRVAAIVRELGGRAVVAIDTYTAALGAGGSDCRPEDVTAFLECIKVELLSKGCTILILHHFGKDSSRGGRGWSGLNAALDFELEIARDGELRTMRITKSRDGSDSQPALCYQFRGRELGVNQYGEPVTAVVVEHLADESEPKHGKKRSPKARAALNTLWEMIKDRSRSLPIPDEAGKRCAILGAWERECIAPGVISQTKEERDRRKLFRAAMEELMAAAAIVVDDQRVFPAPKAGGNGRGDPGTELR